jgi:hypothetical protein
MSSQNGIGSELAMTLVEDPSGRLGTFRMKDQPSLQIVNYLI